MSHHGAPVSPGTAPVIVALDTADLPTAVHWADQVAPHVRAVKVGLELYLRHGPAAVHAVQAGCDRPVFLDLKLHDIPHTVAGAARSVAGLHPAYLTVHAAGGQAMIRAAVDAAPQVTVTAVTVLTSLDAHQLGRIGMGSDPLAAVLRLAVLAVAAGAGALVCSPIEVAAVRAEVGPAVTLITPGVRPADHGAGADDQARVSSPEQALAAGADLLVIGRPITAAGRPGAAAADLARHLARPPAPQPAPPARHPADTPSGALPPAAIRQ